MVFESLVNPVKAERHPLRMFLLGIFYSSIGVLLSLWIFGQWPSLVMVFLTVMASVPLVYNTIKYEEKQDKEIHDEMSLLKQHKKAISFLVMLFLGFVVGFTFWYLVLPSHLVSRLFLTQIETLNNLNSATGQFVSAQSFMIIYVNNMRVLFFCLFFSFFYGAGAIFILVWNASIIAAAMGGLIKKGILSIASKIGLVATGSYMHLFVCGLLRYLSHGVLEILGYFIGGLAGGIISVAVIRHDFGTKEFNHIIADSLDLIILAIVVLFLAALVEVFITPLIFRTFCRGFVSVL